MKPTITQCVCVCVFFSPDLTTYARVHMPPPFPTPHLPSPPLPSHPSPRLVYDGGGSTIDSDTTPWQSSIVSGHLVPPSDPGSREKEGIVCRVTTPSAMEVADLENHTTGPCLEPNVAMGLETKNGDFIGVFHDNDKDSGTPKAASAAAHPNLGPRRTGCPREEGGCPDPSLLIVTVPHLVGLAELVWPHEETPLAEKDEKEAWACPQARKLSTCPQAVGSTGVGVSTLYPEGAAVIGLDFVYVPEESWRCCSYLLPVLAPVCKPFAYPCGEDEL